MDDKQRQALFEIGIIIIGASGFGSWMNHGGAGLWMFLVLSILNNIANGINK